MLRLILHVSAISRSERVTRVVLVISLPLSVSFFSLDAHACINSTVRDGAFLESRDTHRLCVIANADDSAGQGMYDGLRNRFETFGMGLNIELLRVSADDPSVRWSMYGIPSAPPSLPVVVLAGYHGAERRTFFIDYWESAPSIEDFDVLKESPVREAIRREVIRRLAVLLYVPGTGSDAGISEDVLDSVVDTWAKRERLGLSVVRLNRADKRERLLLSFIGVGTPGPDWVSVVFGRGKLMPPLEGSDITEARLNGLIECLLAECTCLRPPCSLGVDIPMVWEETLDASIVPLRAISPDMGFTWAAPLGSEASDLHIGRRIFTVTMWTLGALLVVVSIATVVIVRRRNRRDVASFVD